MPQLGFKPRSVSLRVCTHYTTHVGGREEVGGGRWERGHTGGSTARSDKLRATIRLVAGPSARGHLFCLVTQKGAWSLEDAQMAWTTTAEHQAGWQRARPGVGGGRGGRPWRAPQGAGTCGNVPRACSGPSPWAGRRASALMETVAGSGDVRGQALSIDGCLGW